jgi:protein-S-isoprenylcysteine O-methyltransferase Ste14
MDWNKARRDPWVWGQILLTLLIVAIAPVLPRYINLGAFDFPLNRIDPDWIRRLGIVILACGLAMVIWGVRSLGRNLTPSVEPLPMSTLITTGAYARVRHPIYTGAVLLLAGYTLAWSNWTLALLLGLVARLYFDAKAKAEERWLLERYPSYRSYMRHVPRRVL